MSEQQWLCRYCGRAIPGEVSSQPCPGSPDQMHRRGEPWNPDTETVPDQNAIVVAGALYTVLSSHPSITDVEVVEGMQGLRLRLEFMASPYRLTVTREEQPWPMSPDTP